LLTVATNAWKTQSGNLPKEDELRHFLRQVYVEVYDFECGQRFERQAENDIRGHIVTDSMQACHVWKN